MVERNLIFVYLFSNTYNWTCVLGLVETWLVSVLKQENLKTGMSFRRKNKE